LFWRAQAFRSKYKVVACGGIPLAIKIVEGRTRL
jgi:hypothetical protein